MKKKQASTICDRVLALKDFFKHYYCLDEENEFKIWLQYHDADSAVDEFFDNLHKIMTDSFTPALAKLFAGEPEQMSEILKKDKILGEFFENQLIVLETFSEEWEKYVNEDDTYIEITLNPDNDINSVLNSNDKKVVKFEQKEEKKKRDD